MQMNRNVKTVLSEELLGDEVKELKDNQSFVFENFEVIRSEESLYWGEVIDIRSSVGKYPDGNEYKRGDVIFKITDECGDSEAIYTFDLGIAIKSNRRLQNLLIKTIYKIPVGNSINIKSLLLGKKSQLKLKNYTDKYGAITSYVIELI